jgi:cell division protease FtsH
MTSSKFNGYLEDKFKKVIVYNKTEAEVFLKAGGKRKRTPKVAKDIFDRPNKGPQYI